MPSLFRVGAVMVAAFWLVSADAGAQGSASDALPSARILSPEPNSFLTGVVTLSALVDVSAPVTSVTFFVDGRQVCIITARPFECEWEAGSDVVAHQIRAVFNLPEGDRVARTVRTKGLG